MKVIQVPAIFQPTNRAPYPDHNNTTLEEEMSSRLIPEASKINSSLSYLPIFWTTYFVRNNFSHDEAAMRRLKQFVSTIKEPWFTITQYDDGCLMTSEDTKQKFISMSAGGHGDIYLPLTCHPRKLKVERLPEKYLASFVGNILTYGWRSDFKIKLENKPGFFIHDSHNDKKSEDIFESTMLQSRFALCPRGYGRTSFRLYEAMQMGTIPIYISDIHMLPFEKYLDWGEFCTLCSLQDIEKIPEMISGYSEGTIRRMSKMCMEVWNEYFSYEACAKMIVKILGEL